MLGKAASGLFRTLDILAFGQNGNRNKQVKTRDFYCHK